MKFSAGAAPSRKIVFIATAAFLQSKISKSKSKKLVVWDYFWFFWQGTDPEHRIHIRNISSYQIFVRIGTKI